MIVLGLAGKEAGRARPLASSMPIGFAPSLGEEGTDRRPVSLAAGGAIFEAESMFPRLLLSTEEAALTGFAGSV